jgi:hypothetical protein
VGGVLFPSNCSLTSLQEYLAKRAALIDLKKNTPEVVHVRYRPTKP